MKHGYEVRQKEKARIQSLEERLEEAELGEKYCERQRKLDEENYPPIIYELRQELAECKAPTVEEVDKILELKNGKK